MVGPAVQVLLWKIHVSAREFPPDHPPNSTAPLRPGSFAIETNAREDGEVVSVSFVHVVPTNVHVSERVDNVWVAPPNRTTTPSVESNAIPAENRADGCVAGRASSKCRR